MKTKKCVSTSGLVCGRIISDLPGGSKPVNPASWYPKKKSWNVVITTFLKVGLSSEKNLLQFTSLWFQTLSYPCTSTNFHVMSFSQFMYECQHCLYLPNHLFVLKLLNIIHLLTMHCRFWSHIRCNECPSCLRNQTAIQGENFSDITNIHLYGPLRQTMYLGSSQGHWKMPQPNFQPSLDLNCVSRIPLIG